ncbi:MAG: allophanate hydrolase subunit 1 [Rhodobacteraceae bacterium]|nr:allophanate hydrolase subunit 1 [Paracoccaceae bacterium]
MSDPAPRIARLGLSGLLVSFADRLSDPANRAALALRAAVEAEAWPGVVETAPSLASLFVRVDPEVTDPAEIEDRLRTLATARDWTAAPLPAGRRLWRVPCAFGGTAGPQLAEAADLAGVSAEAAIAQLTAAPVRVLTLGFSPGQPYMGTLPETWDIPRQTELTREVPVGALVVAVRQLIIFTAPSPTGWRHIGQTGFRGFQPQSPTPILLRAGDEVQLIPVDPGALDGLDPPGGTSEALP